MNGLTILGYASFIVSLIGIILNAKKKIACWPVWIASNCGWIIYSLYQSDLPQILLWITFTAFNFYGWIKWSADKAPSKPFTGNYNI